MHQFFFHIGQYVDLLKKTLSKPEKAIVYYRRTLKEIEVLGLNSVGLIVLVSLFSGAVLALQLAINMSNPLLPKFLIGLGTRDSMLLEFSSTIMAIILAGKIGSHISSEIGSMRVTEQIDSLEMMGINAAGYLILPKLIAILLILPLLCIISSFVGIVGGLLVGPFTGTMRVSDYMDGITYLFNPYYITFSVIKTIFFAFMIATIPSYYGYHVEGGALEVGKAGTKSVVTTIIMILVFDLILAQILLK
ncbi:MAG: ABC transporter permease [Bacteroidota bacterium]|nr:ABC transporter permease [Bacteroidota bacterium]MDP4205968.1 ABC transporter permease [Bacteroidota bacterium]